MRYVRAQDGEALPDVGDLKPFKAVVIVEERPSREWQMTVSRWLVESGCLFMMAWGEDCGSWDDSVDFANLEAFDFGDIPEGQDVMTTWHESDSLEDVFRFAKSWALHPSGQLDNSLIVHIGAEDRRSELETALREA